jgi:hypothetical protein
MLGDPGNLAGSDGAWPTTEDRRGGFPEIGDCGRVDIICVPREYAWAGAINTGECEDPGWPKSDDQ